MVGDINHNILSDFQEDLDYVYPENKANLHLPSTLESTSSGRFLNFSVALNAPVHNCDITLKLTPTPIIQQDKIGSNILVINIPFSNNYSHALHDVLPKLLMLDSQKKYCKIITGTNPLLEQLIQTLQIKFSERIVFVKKELNFNCDNITYRSDPAFHVRCIDSTRLFKAHIEEVIKNNITTTKRNRLIYYKREGKDVKHSRSMDYQNEKEIVNLLKNYSDQNGLEFTLFNGLKNGKTMSHIEQIQLFREAKIAVGSHGSGLANTVWMDPANDCRVCEFCSGTEVQVHGGIFNKNYNFLYGGMFSDYIDYNLIPFTKESTKDITHININNLKKFLT